MMPLGPSRSCVFCVSPQLDTLYRGVTTQSHKMLRITDRAFSTLPVSGLEKIYLAVQLSDDLEFLTGREY